MQENGQLTLQSLLCISYCVFSNFFLSFGCINGNSRDTVILVIYFVRKNSFILNMFEIIKYKCICQYSFMLTHYISCIYNTYLNKVSFNVYLVISNMLKWVWKLRCINILTYRRIDSSGTLVQNMKNQLLFFYKLSVVGQNKLWF